jgi:drug/metabolite transporter (DMT)-like permease
MNNENSKRGIFFAVISALLFALMSMSTQQLPRNISSSQISTIRGIITLIFLFPWIYSELPQLIHLKKTRSLWLRSLFGGVAVICYFYNLEHTSAANAKALSNTNPFYVVIFSWWLFKERLNRFEFTGLAILLSGAWLLAIGLKQNDRMIQWFVGNIGSFFTAMAYLSLKRASLKFSAHLIVFCFGISVTIVSALTPGQWSLPHGIDWFWLLLVGITGLLGQIYLTYSYINLKNSIAASLTLLQSVLLIFYDLIWTRRLDSWTEIAGNLLILIGVGAMLYIKATPPTQLKPV